MELMYYITATIDNKLKYFCSIPNDDWKWGNWEEKMSMTDVDANNISKSLRRWYSRENMNIKVELDISC